MIIQRKNEKTLIWFKIITIFPEMFHAFSSYGVVGKAIQKNIINICFFNPRNFTKNKNKSIDDRPYGGGAGMLMNPEPLYLSIKKAKSLSKNAIVIYLSPHGKVLEHKSISELIKKKKLF